MVDAGSKKPGSDESRKLEALITHAASGSKRAQQIILETYWPVIVKAVGARRRRLGNSTTARADTVDLQQDAALRVLRELNKHRFQGRSAFSAWVRKLSGLEVIDAFRRQRAQKRDAAADIALTGRESTYSDELSMETSLDDRRRLTDLLLRVGTLKVDYGAALLLHHIGFSHAEVGEALGCSSEAARKLVSRARAKLKLKET